MLRTVDRDVGQVEPDGFSNRDLRTHLAPLLGLTAGTMTAGRMTYDLRRLRLHGLAEGWAQLAKDGVPHRWVAMARRPYDYVVMARLSVATSAEARR